VQAGEQLVRVNQDTRLNYRVLDLRTPANQGIFRIQSEVGNASSCLFWIMFSIFLPSVLYILFVISLCNIFFYFIEPCMIYDSIKNISKRG
jgi:hypothetical protein